jgi:hypothetical protein
VISLGTMHPGQIRAYWALQPHRYKILRCGRRFGKTEFAKIWIGQGLLQGWECAWLAPQHKIWSEAYMEIKGTLRPLWESGSMGSSVIRLKNSGRLDFWTLGNEIAGRSRRYRRVVIDEAAFAKNGDNKVDGSMMEIWEKAIKPTSFDYGGEVLICSNSVGYRSITSLPTSNRNLARLCSTFRCVLMRQTTKKQPWTRYCAPCDEIISLPNSSRLPADSRGRPQCISRIHASD